MSRRQATRVSHLRPASSLRCSAASVIEVGSAAQLPFGLAALSGPSALVYSRLDLCRVKLFLDIDRRGIEQAASKPYALRCLRKKTAMEYSIEINPRTAVSALRSNIIPSRKYPKEQFCGHSISAFLRFTYRMDHPE